MVSDKESYEAFKKRINAEMRAAIESGAVSVTPMNYKPETIEVETKSCPECGHSTWLTVNRLGYERWQFGELHIQVALPELSDDDREMLLTGMCALCWDDMFGEPDSDDPNDYHADGSICDCFEPYNTERINENGDPEF